MTGGPAAPARYPGAVDHAQRPEAWAVVDQRTGAQLGVGVYLSETQARRMIGSWQVRHDRGGRPDITQDLLDNMQPVLIEKVAAGG